jgi:hypothetical protein
LWFLRLLGYCHRGFEDYRLRPSGELQYALSLHIDHGFLAPLWTWHLSTWLRDYPYIPLGGNRRGRFRTYFPYFNLLMTMLLGGLGHGANWTFVIWGGLHGPALAGHKLWIETSKGRYKMPRFLSWAAAYAFVCFEWIFFRSPNFTTAAVILRKLVLLDRISIGYLYLPLLLAIPLVVGAHCLGRYVGSLAAASEGIRYIRPPHWAMSLYRDCGERLALKPHSAAGYYILLPFPGFVGGFIITLWLLVLYICSRQ